MSELAKTGDYFPAGEIDVISEGREAWGRIKLGVKMLLDDWLVVGEALAIGRAANPGNQAFGAWCAKEGFGEIPSNAKTDAIWVIENKQDVLTLCQNGDASLNNPRVIRSAYRRQLRQLELPEKAKPKTIPKQPKTSVGKVLSAIKDLSGCAMTGESLWRNATDKQRALLLEEFRRAHSFMNQLNEVINHEHS